MENKQCPDCGKTHLFFECNKQLPATHHSDARQTPPSFDELVSMIKKLFTDYLEDYVKAKPSEIKKSWERYKTLNHLYQDGQPEQISAVWVKASERLPGWKKRLKWRDGNNHTYATDGEISLFEMEKPNLEGWEWLDESGTAAAERIADKLMVIVRKQLGDLPQAQTGPVWVKGTRDFPIKKSVIAKKFISHLNREVVGTASSATGEMICFDWGVSSVCLAITHEELNDLVWLDESAAGREDAVELIKYIRENYKPSKEVWKDKFGIALLSDKGVLSMYKQQKEK